MSRTKRVVIIGGGMMGVGLLYQLAELGWRDVLLIEKGELTSGSTWHAAGQCASFLGSYSLAKLHHCGVSLYPKLEALTGQYIGWHGCGGIRLATTAKELDWFRYVQGFSRDVGFRMEIIGPREIQRINPFVTVEGVLAGAWTLDDGHVDPTGCCQALALAARRLGAEILRHSRVTGIDQRPGGEWLVHSEKGDVIAEHVVNAAGCHAGEIATMVGTRIPLVNMEHQYVVTETLKEFQERAEEIPVMRDPYVLGYYRQEQKAGLIGIYEPRGAREAWAARGGVPDWSSDNELFGGDLDRIAPWLERAMERMPIFATVGIKRIIHGAIAHTPDGNPLLGPAPGPRNFWMCCGSSVGIAQGAGCGKYLAQWMTAGAAEINMKDFDSRRFGPFADEAYTQAKCHDDYHHMFVTHLPGEERPAGRPTRRSPLHDRLVERGCIHTEGGGYERPKWFSPDGAPERPGFRRTNAFGCVRAECLAVAERVGICDLSSLAKFEVAGHDAARYLDRILANRLPRKAGGIVLAHLLTESGRVETDVTRLADDRFYLLSSIAAEQRDFDFLQQLRAPQEEVRIDNVTERYGVLVVAGPRSRELLTPLVSVALDNAAFPWLSARPLEVGTIAVRALRVNYVGELGWELHAPLEDLAPLYDRLCSAGQGLGVADFGLYAINSLRMEKAYRSWGSELTNEITLADSGMERFCALDKGEFRGRSATQEALCQESARRLACLAIAAEDSDVRGGEPVFAGEAVVGVTTSGAYGHRVDRSLAFAFLEPRTLERDAPLEVELLGSRYRAALLDRAAYDPDNVRLRA
jgi:dimethylglycine dehydrogenase